MFNNDTLLDEYREKAINALHTSLPDVDINRIIEYVDNEVLKVKDKKIKAHVRNLYKYIYHDEVDANIIPKIIRENKLNVCSNGYLTECWHPASSQIIIEWLDLRGGLKKQMLICKNQGDTDGFREFHNKEGKVKANTNSLYGSSTMAVSFISNIDMGGAITAQARNFISEMVWNIERFLGKNYAFTNLNEVFLWITKLFQIKNTVNQSLKSEYISYIPTIQDCYDKFNDMCKNIRFSKKDLSNKQDRIMKMIEYWDSDKRIVFYYANDPISFIEKNTKIKDLILWFINSCIQFINPYEIPEDLKENIKLLVNLMREFVFAIIITHKRVLKYRTYRRKSCVIGDTDSTMPSIYEIVLKTLDIYNLRHLIDEPDIEIRLVMIYVTLLSELQDDACVEFTKCCNSYYKDERFFMKMKNEFFFPVLLLFMVKKNYIGIQTIQEGKLIPEKDQVAITGRALGSSGLNAYVSENINNLIINDVLKAKRYDPLTVIEGVEKIKIHIIKAITVEGDISFGIYSRYNGINGLKDPEKVATARACCVWNELYPEDQLAPGDVVYMFDTSIRTEEDLNEFHIPKEIKDNIIDKVFRNNNSLKMDFARFGLQKFAIPIDGLIRKIPDWLIPFIKADMIAEKHLQPIVALYPSLLIPSTRYTVYGSSVKKMGTSRLISC